MTRETAQKHREAYNAFCEGKPIQILSTLGHGWVDCDCPTWSSDRQYRIKPREPREFSIARNSALGAVVSQGGAQIGFGEVIHCREILPDETP